MSLLKSDCVQFSELSAALGCLPGESSGLTNDKTLELWRQWHQQGSLQLGRVERVQADGTRQIQALGITAWMTDEAVAELSSPGTLSCTQRIYEAAAQGKPWLMQAAAIEQAHDSGSLNLVVLHFWSAVDMSSQDFQPVFLQAHASFRDLHQGFGVQSLHQEVASAEALFLTAAGMQIIHGNPSAPHTRVWMGITRADANANPGSTFSFLFFSPPRRLTLKPAVQRMLGLAVTQITDEEIATALGCSRDYVRKLWARAYAAMEQTGVLMQVDPQASSTAAPVRGRERRRTALEFLRANPHEMRPGLPAIRRTADD